MRLLWIVNTIFPYPAKKINRESSCFGGWLNSMHNEIVKNDSIQLAIATTYDGKDFLRFDDENTVYYLIPDKNPNKYNSKLKRFFKEIMSDFNPDIVHIHGTEYPRGLVLANCNFDIPIITSIQGLVSSVGKVYYGNIPMKDLIKSITFRDIVRFDTIFDCKRNFIKRGKYETELIKKSNYIIGRTTWDKSNVLAIDSAKKYFCVNESLREPFYTNDMWDFSKIEQHSLFCSQSSYPIKGLHILLEAINILKPKYPDIKLYISGLNIADDSRFIYKIKRLGYGKYIKKLINKYNLSSNVEFTGYLNAREVKDRLLKSNVFISPSFIENECNSLSEAEILGVPSIATYVGGVTDRIIHGVDGYFYPPTEPAMLAHYIDKVFSDNESAKLLGLNASDKMKKIVDRVKNYNEICNIYNNIVKAGKNE